MSKAERPALFLDRDGTVNDDAGYHVLDYADFRFLPGSLEAIVAFTRAGWPPIFITNQSCVARGTITREGIDAIHARMTEEIRAAGGDVRDVFVCPHWDDDDCDCRKPKPGLFLQAARKYCLDLAHSVYVGDRVHDLVAARAAGCRFVYVGKESLPLEAGMPDHATDSLRDAVPWILRALGPADEDSG